MQWHVDSQDSIRQTQVHTGYNLGDLNGDGLFSALSLSWDLPCTLSVTTITVASCMQSEVRTSHKTALRHTHPSTPLTRSTSLGKPSIFPAPHSSRVVKQPNITKAPELACSSPPIVPARSPLRPRLRSKSTPQCPNQTSSSPLHDTMAPMAHTECDLLPSDVSLNDPYFSLSALNYSACDILVDPSTIVLSASDILSPTSLAFRPDSPESMSGPEERSPSQVRRGTSLHSVAMVDSPSSSTPCIASQPTAMTKRQYALHELLSSERAYASDLALIRDIHLPLALGKSSI